MISSLTSFERGRMLESSSIRISPASTKDGVVENKENLVLSIVNYSDLSETGHDILSFSKFSSKHATVVMDLKKIDSTITSLQDVYIAVCEEAIGRFVYLAKEAKNRRLTIFTSDPFIQELLLKNKFFILPSRAKNDELGVSAWKIF